MLRLPPPSPLFPYTTLFRSVFALGFAAIALAVLSLLLPSMLALKTRKQHEQRYQVKGGKLSLYGVFGLGLMIIVIQLAIRSEEHTSELQSRPHLVCRLLLEK